MSRTPVYGLWYADPYTETSTVRYEDYKRIIALDTQLFELFALFGNGVLTGWEIQNGSGNQVIITAGTGHVGFKGAATVDLTTVSLTPPVNYTIPSTGLMFYMYAKETSNTSIDKSVEFFSSINQLSVDDYNSRYLTNTDSPLSPGGLIELGEVVLRIGNDGHYVLDTPTYNYRDSIGLFNNLTNFIKNHIHIGGANNPGKIDLMRHVKGKIAGSNIQDLDASKITRGTLSPDRQPVFDHNELDHSGTLTHDQLESMLLALDTNQSNYLDDVALADFLQMVLYLKHTMLNIDENLKNLIAFIPGYAPATGWVDTDATTAIVDETNHAILGQLYSGAGTDFVSWDSGIAFKHAMDEYNQSISDYPDYLNLPNPPDLVKRSSDVEVEGEKLKLTKSLGFNAVYRLNESVNPDWTVVTQVIDNESFSSGKSSSFISDVNIGQFWFRLFPDATGKGIVQQDWTTSSNLEFSFKLVDADTQSQIPTDISTINHGDIYFFIVGAVPSGYNPNNSELVTFDPQSDTKISVNQGTLILPHNKYTDGYQTVNIDLGQFADLRTVSGIGFYTETGTGWEPSTNFTFHVKQPDDYSEMNSTAVANYLKLNDSNKTIAVYRYNDQLFHSTGFILFRFSTDQQSSWDRMIVHSTIPTYSGSGGHGPLIDISTRSANTEADLLLDTYTPAVLQPDGITYIIHEPSTRWVEIKVALTASTDGNLTPYLDGLTLYFTNASLSDTRAWSDSETWQDYSQTYNIKITSNPDGIQLKDYSDVALRYFIEGNKINAIYSDGEIATEAVIDGSLNWPLSPIQAYYPRSTSGMLHPSQVSKLLLGGFVIADTGNDRIVETDDNGYVVRILQGNSYLPLVSRDIVVLTATYNERIGQIAVTFSQNLSYSNFALDQISIKSIDGVNKIALSNKNAISNSNMLGGALNNNIETLSAADFTTITSNNLFDLGTQKQLTTRTFVPGIGKSKTNSQQSTSIGSILLVNLTSSGISRIASWGTDFTIEFSPTAYKTTAQSSSPAQPSSSAQLLWREPDSAPTETFPRGTPKPDPTGIFLNSYNPYIAGVSGVVSESYPSASGQTEPITISTQSNILINVPHFVLSDYSFLAESRYLMPDVLSRTSGYYSYPEDSLSKIYLETVQLSPEQWKIIGDRNGDGVINTAFLQDLNGNNTTLEIPVSRVDILYYDIMHPVSVQKDGDTKYMVAQANKISVFQMSINGDVEWSVTDDVVPFAFGAFGAAKYLDNGNVLVISPAVNIIAELVIANKVLVSVMNTKYTPIDAWKSSDGSILIAVSQRSPLGLNSRAYKQNKSGDVIWEWGIGRLGFPTSISQADNGNILVSC